MAGVRRSIRVLPGALLKAREGSMRSNASPPAAKCFASARLNQAD
jgi:hypothetical protein